ncbi:MAG: hypothetical protein RI554_10800 [Trueperaceae bacterium]|nr:hypothetical protein [Trueperaceae bacterium]
MRSLVVALFAAVSSGLALAQVSATDSTELNVTFEYVSTIEAPPATSLSLDGVDADGYARVFVGTVTFAFATSSSDVRAEVISVDGTDVSTISPSDTVFVADASNYLELGVAKNGANASSDNTPFWNGEEFKTVSIVGNDGTGAIDAGSSITNEVGQFTENVNYYLKQVGSGPTQGISTDVEIRYTVSDP